MKNIFRLTFTLMLLVILLIINAYKADEDNYPEKIEWNTHFNAKPDEHSPFAALTATIWQYSYQANIKGAQLHIDFKFVAGVNPDKSWVKHDRIKNKETSSQLLNHEQGHVYINYLLLKEGELKIKNQKYTIYNYKKLIQLNAINISKYYSNMQIRYDNETKHGSDLGAQNEWDIYLNQQLKKYL